jgi:uncharacterized protein YaiE (UPF0345 family)
LSGTRSWQLDNVGGQFRVYMQGTSNSYVFNVSTAGNVGIGTTSPNNYAGYTTLTLDGSSGSEIDFEQGGTLSADMFVNTSAFFVRSVTAIPLVFSTQGSERMRITSGGNVLIGTTSDNGSKLRIVGNAYFQTVGNGNTHQFMGASTDGGAAPVTISNSDATTNSDASPSLVVNKYSTTTSSSARFIQFYAGNIGTAMGGIVGNGASNVQFAALSDIREKENIKQISGSLSKILALNPVEFDWKKSKEHTSAGFIAQEVEKIFPEYVIENFAQQGQETRKGLTGGMTGGIIPVLVKAIQELKQELDTLKNK